MASAIGAGRAYLNNFPLAYRAVCAHIHRVPTIFHTSQYWSFSPKQPLTTSATPQVITDKAIVGVEQMVTQLLAPETSVRLDNILSQHGLCPRRYARQFCRNYEVMELQPDGSKVPILTGATKVNPSRLRIDGEPIQYAGVPLHVIMNKPVGYVCSHADEEGSNVYGLFPRSFLMRKPTLSSIGRLDKHASGLLLFTQNGALNARLTNPKRHCEKEYIVSLKNTLSDDGIEAAAFASGELQLVDGAKCKPAILVPHKHDRTICKVTLTEGRYHQLRRMFAAVGHTVSGIHRTAFAGLRLEDVGLQPGEWRLMTSAELTTVIESSSVKEASPKQHGEKAKLRREVGEDYAAIDDLNEYSSDVDVESE